MVKRAVAEPTSPAPGRASGTARRGDLLLAIGNGAMLSHELARDEITIGRDPACDFAIPHAGLSRRHAILRLGAPCTVQDLGSTNGTRVGDRVLRGGPPVELRDRAAFEIGPFAFVVADRAAAPASRRSRDPLRIVDPTPAGATQVLRDIAAADANILITGETGAGKEVLAATLHALSGRRGPFVQVNCAALSETLLESELFGHEKGAFTGAATAKTGLIEAAAEGTILLDEIGEVPLATQAKLLRAIERREVLRIGAVRPISVDVRFLAATNRDLMAEVDRGAFRADLFYRLDGITLEIPPLRARRGAIGPLAIGFLAALRRPAQISVEALAALEAHAWPGNVRELKAVVERAAVLAGSGEIGARHLVFARGPSSEPVAHTGDDPATDERARIVKALEACAGNQTRAAKQLGISRTSLLNKLRLYAIPRPNDPAGRRS